MAFLATAPSSAAKPQLELRKGDRIVIIGNTLAERMLYYGHFETLLHSRFPDLELVVHNLGYSADELTLRPRQAHFDDHGHTLKDEKPDVLIAAFGFNESFAGPTGLARFKGELEQFIRTATTTRYNGRKPPTLVLLSPIAQEDLKNPHVTDGKKNNENIKLYAHAMAEVAGKNGVLYVDLFTPSELLYESSSHPLTINGIHLSDEGYRQLAPVLDKALFGRRPDRNMADMKALHAAVQEKNLQFFYDYRAVNGCYIYGGRKAPFGVVNFPAEFAKLRKMIRKREQRVWDVAQGKSVPATIDDSDTGDFAHVVSNVRESVHITSPAEEQKSFTLPQGYAINLFASEVDFPDLADPVSMTFDSKGRLWVTTMPSYPMYLPGTKPNDKVLILEDSDNDGRADRSKVFADGLHVPTGMELGGGGVYVAQMPNLVFLKDSDGDDRADSRELIMHGFDTADSHHAMHAFTWDPGGALHWQEGTFHYTQVETPYGPRRCNESGIFRWEPKTLKFDIFVSYGFANPWGHYIDRWGQNFVADASGGANYYATAFSGQVVYPQKHGSMKQFFPMQWRPTCGCELVYSRHFPEDTQGDYLLNNNIGFQGILRYRVREEGSGFAGAAVEPLLKASDPNFRPVALQFGPDGALYVVDWFNPLIGHMQHSLRDPKRDHTHGRIWRITYPKRPLVQKARIAGATVAELLDLLKAYEDRTRYRARRELRERPEPEVLAALETWVAALNKNDPEYWRQMLEALWLHQSLDHVDRALLLAVLGCPEPRARAAATRVVGYWRDRLDDPLELLRKQVNDQHPRVRLEAIRALSFFEGKDASVAQEIALESLAHPQDEYLEYTLSETSKTLDQRIERQPRSPFHGERVPEERQGTIIEMIGKRGSTREITFLYERALAYGGFSAANRVKALDAVSDAASFRGLHPERGLDRLVPLLQSASARVDPALLKSAIRLAGLCKIEAAADALRSIGQSPQSDPALRTLALEALAAIGGRVGREQIASLIAPDQPLATRLLAVAALAKLDATAAAQRAAQILPQSAAQGLDLTPIFTAFLNRKGGADLLAAALEREALPSDAAKQALRVVYALGRADAPLVATLSRAAGISVDQRPLSPEELNNLVALVLSKGDPARGETVFRRADLNCVSCHALAKAGGDVGPDLSSIGQSSPPDYIVNSLLLPDQSIKEPYQTLVVLTSDGQVFQGILTDRDRERIVLKEATGAVRVVPAGSIEDQKPGGSLMPKGLANLMTRAEFLDLVRFLSELGKPGPYSIRATPSIQRWRVLKPVSDALARAVPDRRLFRTEVLQAGPERWSAAYAKVSGALPLSELVTMAGSKTLYLQGQIEVSTAGAVQFDLGDADGVRVWVDDQLTHPGAIALEKNLPAGRHTLTLRVDAKVRSAPEVKLDVKKPPGSAAQFTVAGGR